MDSLFSERMPLANAYHDLLATKGLEWGLIGPREVARLWERHLLPSAALGPLCPAGGSCVDVGSGAGLPGIPLAIARRDLQITLLEPLLRRFNFLVATVAELGLTEQIQVIRGRAEEHSDRYDVVLSRAVAPLTRLVPWCWPLVGVGGSLVAVKGTAAEEELMDCAELLVGKEFSVVELPVGTAGGFTRAVVIRRQGDKASSRQSNKES